MAGEANIAVPDAGVLEVARDFYQRPAVRTLVDICGWFAIDPQAYKCKKPLSPKKSGLKS